MGVHEAEIYRLCCFSSPVKIAGPELADLVLTEIAEMHEECERTAEAQLRSVMAARLMARGENGSCPEDCESGCPHQRCSNGAEK